MPVDLQIDWFLHVEDLVLTDAAFSNVFFIHDSLVAQLVKNLPAVQDSTCNAGDPGSIPGQEDPLEKEMATHSSILAWRIPWTEKP